MPVLADSCEQQLDTMETYRAPTVDKWIDERSTERDVVVVKIE